MNSTRNTTIAAIFTLLLGTQLAWAQSAAADDIVVITDEDNPVTFTVLSESTSKGKGKGKKANQTPSDLSLVSITSPDHGTATPNINDGTVTYTPDFNYFGPDAFSYTVSDGQETATGAIALTVTPVNDDPVAGNDEAWAVQSVAITIDVLVNDSDVDNLQSELSIQNVRQARGFVQINTDGTLSYTSTPNFLGDDVFVYTVIDGSGGSASGTVTVHVTSAEIINNTPVADAQSVTTAEDVAVAITLTGSDPDGDALTFSIAAGPVQGTLSGTAPNLTYTPDENFNGGDSFTFTVNDGEFTSDPATVAITVAPVNDAPVITSSATATATEDVSFSYTATATD
ncbi:MAG: tandem-95 repeat protein, partial [Candidatus Marinimicrobia bacterium]|nr:tandem-95 repeat protein [Candidatus Neomarinimicrobiota bacterium]